MYHYNAKVTRVVDGDTIIADIDLGFNITHTAQRIRLSGLDTPSASTKKGKEATAFVKEMIEGKNIELKTIKDKKEKWGRYLGEVVIPFPNKKDINLNALLIRKKLAVKVEV